jgi:hypothetical protein
MLRVVTVVTLKTRVGGPKFERSQGLTQLYGFTRFLKTNLGKGLGKAALKFIIYFTILHYFSLRD